MVSTISAPPTRSGASAEDDPPGPGGGHRVVILVPAHDEEATIADAVHSLLRQTVPLERIIVACDNCTDGTAPIVRAIAERHPTVEVFETVGNRFRKSGALNAAWCRLVEGRVDFVASMDADTALAPDFIEHALAAMAADPRLGGVCATPTPRPDPTCGRWSRVLWRLQRAEYSRYVAVLRRRDWQVHVLSGAGAVYRAPALRDAARIRRGGPWSLTSLTEDYLLTLDLKANGWDARMSLDMRAYTDVPLTLRALWRQRLRWASGTMGDLRHYGWRPFTRRAILAHVLAAVSIAVRLLFVAAVVAALTTGTGFTLHWIWAFPPVVTAAERSMSLKDLEQRTWRDTAQAALVLPEEAFAVFRELYLIRAAWITFSGRSHPW